MIKNLQSVPVSNADKIIILKYKTKPHDRSYSTNHVADYIFEKAVLKTFTASLRPLPLFLVAKRGDEDFSREYFVPSGCHLFSRILPKIRRSQFKTITNWCCIENLCHGTSRTKPITGFLMSFALRNYIQASLHTCGYVFYL